MKDLSVSQEYFLCALNENGKFPAMSTEIPVCLLAGCLIDLICAESVAIDGDKKLCIRGELSPENQHLSSLYHFIKESKPMKVEKLASEYAFTFSDKRIKVLIRDVGASLEELGCVKAQKGGLLGNTLCFVPDKEAADHVIQNIRAELLEDGVVSDNIAALVSLMDKSNLIKGYFSRYEKDQMRMRLKEIRNIEEMKLVKEMVDYVDTIIAIIAVSGAGH